MKHALRAALAALALTLLTACGADHNDADVAFATQMVPHHEQAVEMARLAPTHEAGPEVTALAARIEKAQASEIRTMKGWLEDWSSGHGGHMDGDDTSDRMGGMMDQDDLDALEAARGAEFDRLFLTQMIAHHQGALDMARTEQDKGQDEDAVALAKRIERTQEAEIAEMEKLLG